MGTHALRDVSDGRESEESILEKSAESVLK
jgi:hypothetical protein